MAVNGVQVEYSTDQLGQLEVFLDAPNDKKDGGSESNRYYMLVKMSIESEHFSFVLLLELVDGGTDTFKRYWTCPGSGPACTGNF